MFCSNCGKEIDNKHKFCSNCGVENPNYITGTDVQITTNRSNAHFEVMNSVNTIFNRDVLTNYLCNLQTLEFAKHKLTKEEQDIEYRIASLGHPMHVRARNTLSDYGTELGVIAFMIGVFLVAMWLNSVLPIFNGFLILIMIVAIIIALFFVGVTIYEHIEDEARFENETRNEEKRLKAEQVEKERLTDILPLVKRDLMQTNDLLNDAYAINIIPAKYRNIYAAYFLYEYISTSSVSLSEALYHCDLDEISRQLDVIIKQQQEIIMQLARSNALNEQIVRQNEQILKHAIAAESNTALATQYSQVAAVNTNTVAAIQGYYFFKHGL